MGINYLFCQVKSTFTILLLASSAFYFSTAHLKYNFRYTQVLKAILMYLRSDQIKDSFIETIQLKTNGTVIMPIHDTVKRI